jgi:hypothetical protein
MKYQNIPFTGPYFYPFFGLSIGNLDELRHYKWTQQFRLDLLNKEVSSLENDNRSYLSG